MKIKIKPTQPKPRKQGTKSILTPPCKSSCYSDFLPSLLLRPSTPPPPSPTSFSGPRASPRTHTRTVCMGVVLAAVPHGTADGFQSPTTMPIPPLA